MEAIDALFFDAHRRRGLTRPLLRDEFVECFRMWMRGRRDFLGRAPIAEALEQEEYDVLSNAAAARIDIRRFLQDDSDSEVTDNPALAEVRATSIPGILIEDDGHSFPALVIRLVYGHLMRDHTAPLPAIRDIPELRPFIVGYTFTSFVEWQIFDLVAAGYARLSGKNKDPLWDELMRWEPESFVLDRAPGFRAWELDVLTDIDCGQFDEIYSDVAWHRDACLDRRQEYPVLVMAFYLRRFHTHLAEMVSNRIQESVRRYCSSPSPKPEESVNLSYEMFSGIIPYCLAMEHLFESDIDLFPTSMERGRRSSWPGVRDWYIHQVYEQISPEVIKVVREAPARLVEPHTAYPFEQATLDRLGVAAAIGSLWLREELTRDAVRAAVRRSKSSPDLANHMKHVRSERKRHERHPKREEDAETGPPPE